MGGFFVVLLDATHGHYQSKHVIWSGPHKTMAEARAMIVDRHPPRTFLIVEVVHEVKTRNLTLVEERDFRAAADAVHEPESKP